MKFRLNMQYFGGRGSTSGGREGGGGGGNNPHETTSLISDREHNPTEVDEVLKTLKDVGEQYGIDVEDVQLVKFKKPDGTMAYYDAAGNLAVNKDYFNSKNMNKAYDECVESQWHPSRGNKTGLEATTAHELGHRLTDVIGKKLGLNFWGKGNKDEVSTKIVKEACKITGDKGVVKFARKISRYATASNAETIAEAFSDVYCNGKKASKQSQAIMQVINKYYGKKGGKK